MDQQILETASASERQQVLRDTCVSVEEMTYSRPFDHAQLITKKDELARYDIKLDMLEAEKKEEVKALNERIKSLKKARQKVLEGVRRGAEEVTEDVFLMEDYDEGMMGYYNAEGVLIHHRPLMPEERQLRIKITGTNN